MKTPIGTLAGVAAAAIVGITAFSHHQVQAQDKAKEGTESRFSTDFTAAIRYDYTVVSGSDLPRFEADVKQKLADKYNLQGGLSVVYRNEQTWYYQAMSRKVVGGP